MKRFVLSLLLLLALISTAHSATYCVSTSGSDSANGVPPTCWLTIGKAAATVAAGDTVNIGDGTFNERVTISTSGTAGNPVTWQGAGVDSTIVDGGTLVNDWQRSDVAGASFCSDPTKVYTKTHASLGFTPHSASWNDKQIVFAGDPYSSSLCQDIGNTGTFWDGREVLAVNIGTRVYIRYRDGRNPNSSTVKLSPLNVGVFTLNGKNYNTFRGMTVKDGYNIFRLVGGSANNVIEQNKLRLCGWCIQMDTATATVIANNEITLDYIYEDFGHPRSRSTTDFNALDNHRVLGEVEGVALYLVGGASVTNNIISQNHIHHIMAGIWPANETNLTIAENTFNNCGDYCILFQGFTLPNMQIRDNTFHEFHESMRVGGGTGPVYYYRNKLSMDSYASEPSSSGGASGIYWSMFGQTISSHGMYIYHNNFSTATAGTYANECMANVYWVNNIFSSTRPFIGPMTCNPAFWDYNWMGGTGPSVPGAAGGTGTHNKVLPNQFIWPLSQVPRSWPLDSGSSARLMGIDLSTTWTAGTLGSKAALPGMLPGYFTGAAPDAGAVQFNATPTPGTIALTASTYSISESGSSVTITLRRSGGSAGAVGVSFATSNGTATAGSDYTAVSQSVAWADAEITDKTVSIPITSDVSVEGNETVNIAITSPTGGATLGTPNTAVLTIVDDDNPPSAGTLQFSASTYSVAENGSSVTITVTRAGGSAGAVGVTYATSNGTATATADYTAATNTLSWSDGETASKTFNVTILDDSTYEGSETVTLTLSSATGGASLGAPTTAVLTITEDDAAPAGLAARWPFEETSGAGDGASSADTSGNNRTLSLFGGGGANLGSGALNLGGAENDYATAAVGTTWQGDYTIIIDVAAASTGQAAGKAIFSNFGNWFQTDTIDSMQIDVNGSSPGSYRVKTTTNTYAIATVTTSRQIIAVVKSGTSLKTYNNGTLTNTHTVGASESNNFRDYIFGVNRSGTLYFAGAVYDAWIYKGALSDAEVAAFSAVTTPTAPSAMSCARSTTADVINCTWTDNASDEENIIVHQNVASAGYALTATLAPNSASYSAPMVTGGAAHCYKAAASNSSGASAFATESCVTAPPFNPHAVTASAGNTQALIAWQNFGADVGGTLILMRSGAAVADRPSDTTDYNANDTIGSSTVIFSGSALTPNYTKTSLSNGTTYHFKVFTKSVSGSRYSAGVAASTTPAAPTVAGNRNIRTSAVPVVNPGTASNRGVRQ